MTRPTSEQEALWAEVHAGCADGDGCEVKPLLEELVALRAELADANKKFAHQHEALWNTAEQLAELSDALEPIRDALPDTVRAVLAKVHP